MTNTNLEKIYQRRFKDDLEFKKKMWYVFCEDFFQKYVPKDAVILDVGAGYCEFINSIKGRRKIALDLNSELKNYADSDVEPVIGDFTEMKGILDSSCDVVFVSSFFEHLTKGDILKVLNQIHRVLKRGGKLLILQPNIRLCYKDYWNFFDHITPLDDRSLSEALETNGFRVAECRVRFLPYTIKSRFPKSIFLIKVYLKVPILHYIFGKQTFICAERI